MKPKLKNDTLYVPTSSGIYFVSNNASLPLSGNQIYQWVDRLAPYLDGTHTLEEITGSLSTERGEMVTKLVTALHDNGFVKDVTGDRPHTLERDELETYTREIAFIDYYQDSAAHRFERFRNSRILAVGSGLTLTALVQANLHSGVRQLDVWTTRECSTNTARHREYLERAQGRGPAQSLVEHAADESFTDEATLCSALAGFDAVLHVSDRPMLGRARLLNELCVMQGTVLVQAVIAGGRALVGPLVSPNASASCWECAWLRYLGQRSGEVEGGWVDRPDATVSEFLAGPTASIVSNQLSFEIFKHLTGAGPLATEGSVVMVDLETPYSSEHPVFQHPRCSQHGAERQSESTFLQGMHRLTEGGQINEATFSQRAAVCFDRETGLFGGLDEHEFEQLPLNVSQATIADPTLNPGGEHPAAIGVATEFTTARTRATRRACELYAARVADAELNFGEQTGSVWGHELTTGRVRRLDGPTMLPESRTSLRASPGLAAGFSWSEAVGSGLLGQCRELTVAELEHADAPFAPVAVSGSILSETGRRYQRMLEVIGHQVTVYDVTGTLGIPTVAACVGDQTVAYSCHVDLAQALEVLFERVIRAYQAYVNDQPEYAPDTVPELPAVLRGSHPTVPNYPAPSAWPQREALLRDRLVAGGWSPIAVPLDQDPTLRDVLPYIAIVVLMRMEQP